MPLTKRAVSPVNISRNVIPLVIRSDELQCTANGSIANLIRQLSSLCKHSENIFGEISDKAILLMNRTNSLQQRIDRLNSKAHLLDSEKDQVPAPLNEANMRKAFKSTMLVDQHILNRSTLPKALGERYAKCDPPPDLDTLNIYRESSTPALSLYTNPSFFFDKWKNETLKDVAERPRRVKSPNDGSKSPKKRRKNPSGQGPLGTTMYNDMHRNRQISGSRINPQNEVFSFPEEYQAPQALGLQLNFKNQNQHPANHNIVAPLGMTMHHHPQQNVHPNQQRSVQMSTNRGSPIIKRPTEAPPPPCSAMNLDHLPPPDMSILSIDDDDDVLPLPPPQLLMHTSIVHQLPAEVQSTIQFVEPSAAPPTNVPPPPPPPPPVLNSLTAATFAAPKPDGEASSSNPPQPKPVDSRSDLLAQIQSGIQLKKVERAEAKAAEKAALSSDVAAILKERMEKFLGTEDTSSEEEPDDGEWD